MATYQHYVPQFYLKGFLDPSSLGIKKRKPFLWVVDLKQGSVRKRAPKKVGGLTGFNDLLVDEFLKADLSSVLDDIFTRAENYASPIIKRIRDRQFQMTLQDRADLSKFIGLQLTRVPIYRQYIGTKMGEDILPYLVTHDSKLRHKLSEDPQWFKKYISSDKLKVHLQFESENHRKAQETLISFFAGYDRFGELIFTRQWIFLLAEEGSFFTSDNPVQMLSIDAKPLTIDFKGRNESLEIAFPISSTCVLWMHAHYEHPKISSIEIETIDRSTVTKLNRNILPTIGQFVFCSSKEQGEWVLHEMRK